jgi:hypothetical protein
LALASIGNWPSGAGIPNFSSNDIAHRTESMEKRPCSILLKSLNLGNIMEKNVLMIAKTVCRLVLTSDGGQITEPCI